MMDQYEQQDASVSYILEIQRELLTAHLGTGHFISALKKVAAHMFAEEAFLWFGENSENVSRGVFLTSGNSFFSEKTDFSWEYPQLYKKVIQRDGIMLHSTGEIVQELPSVGDELVKKGVFSLMLFPVHGTNGRFRLLLGACNFSDKIENLKPLELVSLSFLMAADHAHDHCALEKAARTDVMTGLRNRNSYHVALSALARENAESVGCIYIDANGLHEINNYLGHYAGDEMLRTVARALRRHFEEEQVFRVGGDEFIVLCRDWEQQRLQEEMSVVCQELQENGYEISVGIQWNDGARMPDEIVNEAEEKMRLDKKQFYARTGKKRMLGNLNRQLEELLAEKQDADTFLSVLEPEFKGVYFVDLNSDTVRHIFIPDYFEKLLEETGDSFGRAMLRYAQRYVKDTYEEAFQSVTDYIWLKQQLEKNEVLEFTYQKQDGAFLRLSIVKLKSDRRKEYRTLWTFKHKIQEVQEL